LPDFVKFSYIACCFIIALCTLKWARAKKDWAFLCAGLGATLAADYFLILFDDQKAGVPIFCIAHAFYILRACAPDYKKAARLFLVAAAFLLAFLFFLDKIAAVSLFYAVLFMMNLTVSFRGRFGNRILVVAGLALFALCDVNVFLYNLPRFAKYPVGYSLVSYRLIWCFYAPSQLLLALSAVMFGRRRAN